GGLSTLPCIIIELVLDKGFGINPKTVPGAIETSFLSAGLVEESAKAVCLYLAVWRHPAFDERLDGIVYATRAGLGFALVVIVGGYFWLRSLGRQALAADDAAEAKAQQAAQQTASARQVPRGFGFVLR